MGVPRRWATAGRENYRGPYSPKTSAGCLTGDGWALSDPLVEESYAYSTSAARDYRSPGKGCGLLREGGCSVNEECAFTEPEKTTHSVPFLCQLLKVVRSSF
jgi:hypothetical protein